MKSLMLSLSATLALTACGSSPSSDPAPTRYDLGSGAYALLTPTRLDYVATGAPVTVCRDEKTGTQTYTVEDNVYGTKTVAIPPGVSVLNVYRCPVQRV